MKKVLTDEQFNMYVRLLFETIKNNLDIYDSERQDDKLTKVIAPIINIFLTIPFNFLLNKFWTFKNKNEK